MIEVKNVTPGDSGKFFTIALQIALAILVIVLFFGSWFVVNVGEVGVTFNRITGVTASHQQGLHFKIPILVSFTKFDVKTQKIDIKAISASKDLQEVTFELAINFHLQYDRVDQLYMRVGQDYVNKVINPAVEETIKSAAAKFPVERIIVDRHLLREEMMDTLKTRLANYDIVTEAVNIIDIDFTQEFNAVVEQKQIEEQKIKTAEYQRRQAEELKQKSILEAEAEARKQQLLRESVSEKVISLKWIEKWDGKLPQIITGKDGVMMMLPASKEDK
jgi:regulator of protease activity HflC (stomatin/prohibitin superfamily)